jgi:hypothetical protein
MQNRLTKQELVEIVKKILSVEGSEEQMYPFTGYLKLR